MATKSKSRRPASAARTPSSGSSGKANLKGTLQKLGIDESVVDLWRDQAKLTVSRKVQTSIEEFDVSSAIDMAKKYASMSSEKLKQVSKKNPKSFYSGLAAILVGAGLLAAAARTSSEPAAPRKSGGRKSSDDTGAVEI